MNPSLAREIGKEVLRLTKAKFATHSKAAKDQWKPLGQNESALVSVLLKKPWNELIEYLKKQKVRIVAVKLPADAPARSLDGAKIPPEVFESLPAPSDEERSALEKSKILSGLAAGKFLCQLSPPVVVVTDATTKGTIVHEFLHSIQNSKNAGYCPAVTKQQETADRFQKGEIDKSAYEKTLITYQVTNALAEKEVYLLMKRNSASLGRLENLNNQEMLDRYQKLLDDAR